MTVSLPAAAQAQGYQPYPIGERGTGLGGAYTALAEDEGGAYYNPAGLAFTTGNSLSVSTSFYGLVFGRVDNGLGGGNDFTYSTINLLPINASSLWHLGKAEEGSAAPWVVAFSVFAPSTLSVDTRNDVRDGAISFFFSSTEKNLQIGPTLAYRSSPRWSFGVSLFGLVHTQSDRVDYTGIVPSMTAGKNNFIQLTISKEQFNVGLLAAAGARWQATDRWSFGAAVRSPSLQAYGSGSQYTRLLYQNNNDNTGGATADTHEVTTVSLLPARVNLGAAFTRPKDLTVSLDAVFYTPLRYVAYHSNGTADDDVIRDSGWVVDAAIGVEKYLTPTVPLRFGLFTDLSGVAEPQVSGPTEDQLHRVGATLTLGLETEHSSTTVGVVATLGLLKSLGLDIGNSFESFKVTGRQFSVFFVLSSSYSY